MKARIGNIRMIYILVMFQLRHSSIFLVLAQESGTVVVDAVVEEGVISEEIVEDFIIEIPSLEPVDAAEMMNEEVVVSDSLHDELSFVLEEKEEQMTGVSVANMGTGVVVVAVDTGNMEQVITLYDNASGSVLGIDGTGDSFFSPVEELTLYEDDEGEYVEVLAEDELHTHGTGQEVSGLTVFATGINISDSSLQQQHMQKISGAQEQGATLMLRQDLLLEAGEEALLGQQAHRSAGLENPSRAYIKGTTTIKSMKKGRITLDDFQVEKLGVSPDGFSATVVAGLKLGPDDDHLVFSQPVQLDIAVDAEFEGEEVMVYVYHVGEDKYGTTGLTPNSASSCDDTGVSSDENNIVTVVNGKATIYTCGASTFIVTYIGGASYDNFVDNDTLDKTITITTGEVSVGSTIQDLQVIVDFQPIDSEDPTNFGFTNAYSREVSMVLESPTGTSVTLLSTNTYTNNAYSPRVTVTFDDAAGSSPSGLPATGTFLPSSALSAFDGEDPLGDWTFTLGDNTNLDGVTLHAVSLQITDDAVCGDSSIEGSEGCDDGGTSGGDGCDASCRIENSYACNFSGSGVEGNNSCASGICDETETTPTCEAADTCGNSIVEGSEVCDDGNTTAGDGCSSACAIERCGNGTIDIAAVAGYTFFAEDFESIGNGTLTSDGTIYSTGGYELRFENDTVFGRVRYGTARVQDNGGGGAATLDVTTNGNFNVNYLIFDIDMSDALETTDLELAFDWADHGDESQTNDRVWIRGSSGDSWITVYNWKANDIGNGVYQSVTSLDISDYLSNAGQTVSSSFQLRFGQQDNFRATSTTASDGFSVDNIEITGTLPGPVSDEVCDDTNGSSGDGCNDMCEVEPGYVCTGEPSSCIFTQFILINEVEYDTPGNESAGEWFELYNAGTGVVNLSGWTITEKVGTGGTKTYTFGSGVSIAGGGYLLVVNDVTEFSSLYSGVVPDVDMPGTTYFMLSNVPDDYLQLRNPNGDEIDFVAWENSGSGWNIEAIDASICRLSVPDTDTVADWTNMCTSSPGAHNFSGNVAPTDITLSNTILDENIATGSLVGYLSGTDSDGDSLTYVLISGTGDMDNSVFSIVGTQLLIQESPDYENQTGYSIRVQVYDGFGGFYEEVFTITINNVGELLSFEAFALDRDEIKIGTDATVFNSTNLDEIEEMQIDFVIDCPAAFSGDIGINFTADWTSACALGNTQNDTCYSYASGTWISYLSGQETATFRDEGDIGDFISCSFTGNMADTQRSYSCIIDEHYNPNVLKRYGAGFDFTDIKRQDGTGQKITESNMIRVDLDDTKVPDDADRYKLDFRVQVTNNPTLPLEAYLCNADYATGDPGLTTDCAFIAEKTATEITANGGKFRRLFQYDTINQLGGAKYIVLSTDTNETNRYYAIKTFAATTTGRTTHWDYSTNDGTTWSNAGDGYETELNLNWFHNGAGNTAIVFDIVNTCGDFAEQRMTRDIEPTQDYEPLVDILTPENAVIVSGDVLISWLVNEPNDEGYTVDVTAFDGTNTVIIGTGFTSGTTSTIWTTTGVADGNWSIMVLATELAGYKTILTGADAHTVVVDNIIGDVCIVGPDTFGFSGSYETQGYAQSYEQVFTDYFAVQDTRGSDTGYYTTLQVSDFTGMTLSGSIANTALEWYATGVELVGGITNTGVVLASGRNTYRVATGTFTFIQRDTGPNAGKIGEYGVKPRLRLTIPAYTRPDNYTAEICYTLYEE